MSFITDLANEIINTPELAPIAAQKDVKVRILAVERGPSKNNPDNPDMLTVTYELPDHPSAYSVKKYFPLPVPADDSKRRQGKLRNLKTFIAAHGWDFESALSAIYEEDEAGNKAPNTSFLVGSETWVVMASREDEYEGRKIQRNEIESYQ